MLMVLKSPILKLDPKTRITWSLGPRCHLMCIDCTCAFCTDILLQCRTLHYTSMRTSINMPKAITTHNLTDRYATLKKYRKHILCNTWWLKDRQVINVVGLTSRNGHMRTREIDAVRLMWFVIRPLKSWHYVWLNQTPPHPANEESMWWMKIRRHNWQWLLQTWKHPPKNEPSSKGVHFYQDLSQQFQVVENLQNTEPPWFQIQKKIITISLLEP
jgi:hypothetical protein